MLKLMFIALLLAHYTNNISKVNAFSVKQIDVHSPTPATDGNEGNVLINEKAQQTAKSGATKKTSSLMKKCDPCPEGVLCVPPIQCPAHVRMKDHHKPQICDLPGEAFGYCCMTGQNHTSAQEAMPTPRTPMPSVIPLNIVEEGRRKFHKLMHNVAPSAVMPGHPDFLHGIVFHSSPQEDMQNFHLSNAAMEQVVTGQVFAQMEQVPVDDLITNKIDVEFKKTPLAEHCATSHPCRDPRSPYRSFDGSCNNALPQRSHWGAAGQAMERLLPPAYEDGLWAARAHSKDGSPLMGARDVSRKILGDSHRLHPKHNLMLMQFGQFIAHDVSQTASVRNEAGDLIQCCSPDGAAPTTNAHFACMPIPVAPDDDFYAQFNVRCLNFVRLSLAPNTDCKMGYGKQRSKVTHFLDASTVYGSSKQTARELRTFRGGHLRMFNDFGHDLLPLTSEKKVCDSEEPGKTCFKSGDGRTNQIISLIVLHQLFAREHNRIAGVLARLNPRHTDETLFQEARRIVIAQLQHIAYNEFLPAVVGAMQVKRFRLVPQHHGYATDYSSDVNPALTNEFSGAAFRYGHSTVDGKFHVHEGADTQPAEIIDIPDVMFNPSRMRKRTFYDDLLRTLVTQPMQQADSFITTGLSHFLFRGHNPFGLDLAAINIQRGRDQGLRCYNDYLEVMGRRRIQSFQQLPNELASKLARVYRQPDDIDLWIGGLLEQPVADGVVGLTFAEIIADQFSRFKRGDRYFYEYGKQTNSGAFTLDQLHEIRKTTLARVICDNADHLSLMEVSPSAFVRADFPGNQPVRCDSARLPALNLEAWRA